MIQVVAEIKQGIQEILCKLQGEEKSSSDQSDCTIRDKYGLTIT